MNSSSKTNVRYCDSEHFRHHISGHTFCSFATPEITALVPEEQKHKRLRDGGESSHYSFNAVQSASLLLRLNKRFDSIDNDRQEHIVDVLNDINNRFKDSESVLKSVAQQLSNEGTVCTLLKHICDAFKESFISESPHLESLAKNTSVLIDHSANSVLEIRDLRKDLVSVGEVIKATVDRVLNETNDKLDKCCAETASMKFETQLVSASLERLETATQMNGLDMKQEMTELRHQVIQMNEEIKSLRGAIIEDLPNKIIDAFNPLSELGSDISLMDEKEEGLKEEEKVKGSDDEKTDEDKTEDDEATESEKSCASDDSEEI